MLYLGYQCALKADTLRFFHGRYTVTECIIFIHVYIIFCKFDVVECLLKGILQRIPSVEQNISISNRSFQLVLDGSSSFQVVPGDPNSFQLVPGGSSSFLVLVCTIFWFLAFILFTSKNLSSIQRSRLQLFYKNLLLQNLTKLTRNCVGASF